MSDHLHLNLVQAPLGNLDQVATDKIEAAAYLAAAVKLREQADQLELMGQNKLRQAESHHRIEERRQLLDAAVGLAVEMIDSGFDLDDAIVDAAAQAGINSRAIDSWVRAIDKRRNEIDPIERDELIERELSLGTKQSDIAKKAKCSQSHVTVRKSKLKSVTGELLGSDVKPKKPKVKTRKTKVKQSSGDLSTAGGERFDKTIMAMSAQGHSVADISKFVDETEGYVQSVIDGANLEP